MFSLVRRRSASGHSQSDPSRPLYLLLAIVGVCATLIVGLRFFFAVLQEDLNQLSANERGRLFVGEEIVRSIQGIEKEMYRMATTANAAGFARVRRSVDQQLAKLKHDLAVLEHGGTVRREIQLNVEGRENMVREFSYQPDPQRGGYVMERIEIEPMLEQVSTQADELQHLLAARWEHEEGEDRRGYFRNEERIEALFKAVPVYFERLDENANRLFFDSSARLRELESQLEAQRTRLKRAELGLVALVLVLAGLATAVFVVRINLAKRQLEEAVEAMRIARDEAQTASRAKSTFVSRMSHELRTPLNAIIGFGELLEAEPLAPSHRNYVRLINTSGRHLLDLVNQVLDLAKIEAGGLRLERIAFDFGATIEAVKDIVVERAGTKGISFVAAVASDVPRYLQGDPTRLRQVLLNLLANAVKFTEHGSVELRVAADGDRLYFSIRDSGIGMDQETLAGLFQPFVQADASVTRRFGGTGLGLAISRELVHAMGGGMEVESAPGAGTCFWFWVPLLPAEAPFPAPSPQVAGESGPPEPAEIPIALPAPILLVDDNRINQQLAGAMLGRLGLAFDTAADGHECLAHLQAKAYSLVLMDVEMPGMDGITATSIIRAREGEGGSRLPIVAMTANALSDDRDRCLAAGMDGYLAKPISVERLRKELRRVLACAAEGAWSGDGARDMPPRPAAPGSPPSITGDPQIVFDRRRALAVVEGDEALFRELAALFVEDAPVRLRELDAALGARNWRDLSRAAHTLKGVLGNFAAQEGQAVAARLELAAKADSPKAEDLATLAAELRACVETLAASLAAEQEAESTVSHR